MLEDYSAQQQPTLIWNTARGVWERAGTVNLLCEHSELFSETWQTSGTMRNGKVYALQTQEHLTDDSEYSSSGMLRTPSVVDSTGGAISEKQARLRNRMVKVADQAAELAHVNGLKVSSSIATSLMPNEKMTNLPTPVVADAYTGDLKSGQQKDGSMHSIALPHAIAMLPTPTTQDGKNNAGPSQFDRNTKPLNVEAVIATTTNWGRFEPAIRRWEATLGRPAPLPTKADGKDGNHRLSSKFTEWMMGLPEGWVTDVGLKRNDELKACGNGVVPQQAELALRGLLKGLI
jgi:hypothetical protein